MSYAACNENARFGQRVSQSDSRTFLELEDPAVVFEFNEPAAM